MCDQKCKKVSDEDIQPNDYVNFLERQLLELNTDESLALAQIRNIIATSEDSLQSQLNQIENITFQFKG